MNKSTIALFCVVLAVVLAIAHCNSRPKASDASPASPLPATGSQLVPAETASASPSPAPTAAGQAIVQKPDFAKAIAQTQPAVVLLSVFDASGKLVGTGTGFFVAEDGKILTSRSVIDGAAHAVAKTSDGKIHNVIGIVADAPALDLAILKAEIKERAPAMTTKGATPADGGLVSIVSSPLGTHKPTSFEATVMRHPDDKDTLQLSIPVPAEWIGSPAVGGDGSLVGIVIREKPNAPVSIRLTSAFDPLIGQASGKAKWMVEEAPPPPADGPKKIPLAGENGSRRTRLVYSPFPQYPEEARRSAAPVKASGRFRITFAPTGQVRNVAVLQSTRNAALDRAAVEALRQWKATPGEEWTANVPITFQP